MRPRLADARHRDWRFLQHRCRCRSPTASASADTSPPSACCVRRSSNSTGRSPIWRRPSAPPLDHRSRGPAPGAQGQDVRPLAERHAARPLPDPGRQAPPGLPPQKINDFDYTFPTAAWTWASTPDRGAYPPRQHAARHAEQFQPLLPRRPNRRHRIMRRAMPYQLPYNPLDRNDPTTERGLAGFFLSASLMEQFDFVQHNWINASAGFYTVIDPADPVMGVQVPPPELFQRCRPRRPGRAGTSRSSRWRASSSPRRAPMSSFPGLDGVRYVATPPEPAPVARVHKRILLSAFARPKSWRNLPRISALPL